MVGKNDHVSLVKHSNYDEVAYPSNVRVNGGITTIEQANKAIEQIENQLVAYPRELIGILAVRNEELNEIAAHLSQSALSNQFTLCHSNDFDPDKPIWLSTISSGKGLEFRAVHLIGMDHVSKTGPAQRRLSFTGVTRAKTALTVYHQKTLPGYLDAALRTVCNPSPAPISKSRLFGKE
ncbi:ATP-binding domain-containing protein [Delftia sp. GW456-R20]|uniref:ATP-binding domain-containing protein n=1 Tax=Delftia sp. GW456-R20 TaxID=1827145 RepID=UPI0009EDE823|nr:ATP-binding domain-containing protein [Delftia sp. GW456-R20]